MKKRYSEYVNYEYKKDDNWFNPQVGWDTLLFIDPILIKNTKLKEFKNSYKSLVEFFSKAIAYNQSKLPKKLVEKMFSFEEVKEANLGFSYDSNNGSGLTGTTALSVLNNLELFTSKGLFDVSDFEEISLFDRNVSGDRITDMILNILKLDFINYSVNIAKSNSFPLKEFQIKTSFNYKEMRWNIETKELPYITNEEGKDIYVILIPKSFLVKNLYNESDNFIDWIYHNDITYIKEVFDFNLKKDLEKNKSKILKDIIDNNRYGILKKYNDDGMKYKPYDIDSDPQFVNSIYELALDINKKNKDYHLISDKNSTNKSVLDITKLLIDYFKHVIIDCKSYELIIKNGKFVSEPTISKFMHVLLDARITDAGFNVDISPETNSGNGPVDFKISRGDEKVLIENKISSNPKLLNCVDEGKQIHTYLKQEKCEDAFLIVFTNKDSDIDKINELNRKVSAIREYNIKIIDIDCQKRESASKR